MSFLLRITDKGLCIGCHGKGKLDHSSDPYDSMGYRRPNLYPDCPTCGGTGKPSEGQLKRAEVERLGNCNECGFELSYHEPGEANYGFPYGCLRAVIKIVHSLRGT